MTRSLFLIVLCGASCAFADQTKSKYSPSDNVVTTGEQLHRVSPPEENLSPEELERRGDALRGEKNYADAIDFYTLAISKGPSASIYNKRGIAKLQMLRLDEAKKDFERALKLDKKHPEAHNNLGAVLYSKKDYKGAIKHYKRAIDLARNASFYSNLGTAYFARKDYEKAQASYQVALEIDPDVFERQRGHAGTQLFTSNAIERGKYDYVIAKMFAARGDSERCLLYLRKALEEGYPVAKDIQKDEEFAMLRKDPRLKELIESKPVIIN